MKTKNSRIQKAHQVCTIVAAVMLTGGAATPLYAQTTSNETSGEPGRGEQIYKNRACYGCHGYNGTGQTPLANGASGILTNEDIFINYLRLRADQNPVLPRTTMPNFPESSLSDEDAGALYDYIMTFTDQPPEVAEIPALRQILEAAEARQ
jgi:mono/diheme cytochrome c family protein